jgi:hypothetical protein
MQTYNDQLLEAYNLSEGLYRNHDSNDVVDLLCVGPDLRDSTRKMAIVRRMGLGSIWAMDVEDFCLNYVRVMASKIPA